MSYTGPAVTSASSKNRMASASVRCLMKPPTIASTSSRRFTRSVFVLKAGS